MAEPSLHIGVDGRELAGRPTGVGRYLDEVLKAWRQSSHWPHRLTIFTPGPSENAGTWWEQRRLPQLMNRAQIDVLFAPAYTAPILTRCPTVLAVHDVSFFAHPEWFGRREGLRRRLLTKAAARRARFVVTLSEFSATEIVRYVDVPRDRIVLAPPAAAVPAARHSNRAAATVLFVGSLFTRRRIPLLIEGFAKALERQPDARLVLVGENRTTPLIDPRAIARRLGVADHVTWLDYVPEDQLEDLYRSASVCVYLSEYEGFGMPPLEALARGVPPVLLDTRVGREVYGDVASFCDPTPASIGSALAALLSDERLRADRLGRGAALLSRFTWPKTAAILRQTLERAASS